MESETPRHMEILKKVSELSCLQRQFLEENRLEDLLKSQIEREGLFAELKSLAPANYGKGPLKALVEEIVASDSVLYLNIEASLGDIKTKLERIRNSSRVIKAYKIP